MLRTWNLVLLLCSGSQPDTPGPPGTSPGGLRNANVQAPPRPAESDTGVYYTSQGLCFQIGHIPGSRKTKFGGWYTIWFNTGAKGELGKTCGGHGQVTPLAWPPLCVVAFMYVAPELPTRAGLPPTSSSTGTPVGLSQLPLWVPSWSQEWGAGPG